MGNSFTGFRKAGFWSNDYALCLWLAALTHTVRHKTDVPSWLHQASNEWAHEATAPGVGITCPNLDKYITTDERRIVLIEIAEDTLEWVRQLTISGIDCLTLEHCGFCAIPHHNPLQVPAASIQIVGRVGQVFRALILQQIEGKLNVSQIYRKFLPR